jgi:hypothetical protein
MPAMVSSEAEAFAHPAVAARIAALESALAGALAGIAELEAALTTTLARIIELEAGHRAYVSITLGQVGEQLLS